MCCLEMSCLDESLCRTEGYFVTEKILYWAGYRWGPIVVVSLVLIFSGMVRVDEVLDRNFPPFSREELMDMLGSVFSLPLILFVGYLGDGRRFGRLKVLAGILVAGIVLQLISHKSAFINTVIRTFIAPTVSGLGLVIAYECVPLSWRLLTIAVLCMLPSLVATLLELVMRVRILKHMDALVMKVNEDREYLENDIMSGEREIATSKRISAAVTGVFCLIGVSWMLYEYRNTLLAQDPERVCEILALDREEEVPIPSTEIYGKKRIFGDWEWTRGRLLALGFMILMCFALGIAASFHVDNTFVATMVFFDTVNDIWNPAAVIAQGVEVATVMSVIAAWFYNDRRDIRFIIPIGFTLVAIGPLLILSCSVTSITEDVLNREVGLLKQIDTHNRSFYVGIAIGGLINAIGEAIVRLVVYVVTLDFFPTHVRLIGMLGMVASIDCGLCFSQITPLFGLSLRSHDVLWLSYESVVSILGLAVTYVTQWFDQSLLCKDPELNANWLVADDETNSLISANN
jgi:hypothetical protein